MHLPRTSHPRHMAGKDSSGVRAADLLADFDVDAALEPAADFDFEGLFDDDMTPDEEASQPRIRVARHKVAFAVSVTLAALPILALDNFQSAADPAPERSHVEVAGAEVDASLVVPDRLPISELPNATVDVTIARATLYVGDPTTTTSTVEEPTTTTTEKPAPTTTKPAPPTTKAAPVTTVAPAAAERSGPDPGAESTWDELAQCESGGNWSAVSEPRSGMQYYGGLQFSRSSWEAVGGTGLPSDAPKATQIEMGKRLQARSGWGQWPACTRKLGYR